MQVGFVLSLIFAIIIAVFAIKNGNEVNIDFIVTTKQVSQAIVILVSTALGAIIVTILGLVRQVKLTMKIREQKSIIEKLRNNNMDKELEDNVGLTNDVVMDSEKADKGDKKNIEKDSYNENEKINN
ncbi:LapA family protein [Dethiothermospora halolimnae]|uniref:LapA family protein n=1 Tax=Dethiothermospora halolimnae TaxID=3114390 RepID=UPI003CCC32A1